jgi:hypothetical protein
MKPSNSRSSSPTQIKNLDLNRLEEFRRGAQSKRVELRRVTSSRNLLERPYIKIG